MIKIYRDWADNVSKLLILLSMTHLCLDPILRQSVNVRYKVRLAGDFINKR